MTSLYNLQSQSRLKLYEIDASNSKTHTSFPWVPEWVSEWANEWMSAVERVSGASSAEQANEWAVRANERSRGASGTVLYASISYSFNLLCSDPTKSSILDLYDAHNVCVCACVCACITHFPSTLEKSGTFDDLNALWSLWMDRGTDSLIEMEGCEKTFKKNPKKAKMI